MTRIAYPVFILITAIAAAGCVKYHEQPLSPDEAEAAFSSRSLSSPGLREYISDSLQREVEPWPPASWDFTLLTLAAFYYSPDLDLARARWQGAEAGVKSAGERPNPSLDYLLNLELILNIPVESAGKRGRRMDEARSTADAARLDIYSAAWQVRSRVRSSMLELCWASDSEPIVRERLEAEDLVLHLAEQRLNEGEAAQDQAIRARVARDRSALILAAAQRRTGRAEADLAAAVGVPLPALEKIVFSFELFHEMPDPPALDELKKTSLSNRPDLMAALSEYKAAQSALQLEIAKQYPDFSIGPGYAWEAGADEWTVAASVTLPVFSRNKGGIAVAEAARTEAAERFKALQAGAIGEIERALSDYQGSLGELEAADSVLDARTKLYASQKAGFDAGETDRLELSETRERMLGARASRLDAAMRAQVALGRLEDAAQYSLAPSVTPPDFTKDPRGKESD